MRLIFLVMSCDSEIACVFVTETDYWVMISLYPFFFLKNVFLGEYVVSVRIGFYIFCASRSIPFKNFGLIFTLK